MGGSAGLCAAIVLEINNDCLPGLRATSCSFHWTKAWIVLDRCSACTLPPLGVHSSQAPILPFLPTHSPSHTLVRTHISLASAIIEEDIGQ